MPYTEANYENAVVSLFQNDLGYTHLYGPDVERDYHSPLYEDGLWSALARLNPRLPQAALQEAVDKLRTFDTGTLPKYFCSRVPMPAEIQQYWQHLSRLHQPHTKPVNIGLHQIYWICATCRQKRA